MSLAIELLHLCDYNLSPPSGFILFQRHMQGLELLLAEELLLLLLQ